MDVGEGAGFDEALDLPQVALLVLQQRLRNAHQRAVGARGEVGGADAERNLESGGALAVLGRVGLRARGAPAVWGGPEVPEELGGGEVSREEVEGVDIGGA